MKHARRGTTLLELLVYSLLLGVLLLAVYGVFSAGMKYFRFIEATSDLRGQAQTTLIRIAAELAETRGYTVLVDDEALIFCSPRNRAGSYTYDAYGNLQWHRFVGYYRESDGRILRTPVYLSTPRSTPANASTIVGTISNPSALPETEVIAHSCTELTFTTEPAGSESPTTVRITARFERAVQSNRGGTADNRIDVTTTVQLQN